MKLHLDDARLKAINELATMGPVSHSDRNSIYDQALHLLQRNFGRKLTEKDINMYLPEAVSFIRLATEDNRPTDENNEQQGQQRRRRRSSDNDVDRSQHSPPTKRQGAELNETNAHTADQTVEPMEDIAIQPETPKSTRATKVPRTPQPERRASTSTTPNKFFIAAAGTPIRLPRRLGAPESTVVDHQAGSKTTRWEAPNPRRHQRTVIIGDSNVRFVTGDDDWVTHVYPGAHIRDASELLDRTLIVPSVRTYIVGFGYNHLSSNEDLVDLSSHYSQAINSLKIRSKRPVLVLGLTILNHLDVVMKARALQFNKILRGLYDQDFIEPVSSDQATAREENPRPTDVHFNNETADLVVDKVRVRLTTKN